MSEVEDLRVEVDRLRAIVETMKAPTRGPFSHRRSIGRIANRLLAERDAAEAKVAQFTDIISSVELDDIGGLCGELIHDLRAALA